MSRRYFYVTPSQVSFFITAMQKRHILLIAIGFLTLFAGGIFLFLNSGQQPNPGPAYDHRPAGYTIPACTPTDIAAKVKAAPLQAQQKAIDEQDTQLTLRYLSGIVSNWKDDPGDKVDYQQQRQVLLDQWGALQAQVTALIGNVYCQ